MSNKDTKKISCYLTELTEEFSSLVAGKHTDKIYISVPSTSLCYSLSYALQTEVSGRDGGLGISGISPSSFFLFASPQLIRTWNALNGVTVAKDVL